MANVAGVPVDVSGQGIGGSGGNKNAIVVTWTFNSATDTPLPIEAPNHAAESFEAFISGGTPTITLNGSNDGVNYQPLTKFPAGTPITGTTSFINQINENVLFYQPATTAAAGNVTATLYLVGINPARIGQ